MTGVDADALVSCMSAGGVAVFPADTVYGLACAPDSPDGVARLHRLKGRRPDKPCAVMFFDREPALAALPELPRRTREALERLLPGAVTVLLPNPAGRFPLAGGTGGTGGTGALGLRVPRLDEVLAPLRDVRGAVLQSSANLAGGPDPSRLEDVPREIRDGADLVLDAGPLPGTSSTVVDLTHFHDSGKWRVVREGAVPAAELAPLLG